MNLSLESLPASVSVIDGVSGRPALAVQSPHSRGVVPMQGAQVTSFVPDAGRDLLWLSPGAVASDDKAIRGGVPVCFPWFNAGPSGDMRPSHGPARLAQWQLKNVEETPDAVALTFVLGADDLADVPGGESWPRGLHAEYTVTFGRALDLTFTARNSSTTEVTAEVALHAYLSVDDVAEARVDGITGHPYRDQVTQQVGKYDGPFAIAGEVDHVVETREALTLRDGARVVTLARHGSPQVVIWNPAADKASRMSDVPGASWREFVCLEAAAVLDGALVVPAGGVAQLRARYAEAG